MNKKIKMFIICAVFALIISCKNYAISKDSESLEQSEQDLKSSKQIEQEIKKEFNGLLNILETKDLSKLDTKDTSEIEKKIKELKDIIEKADAKKTSLEKYREYEEVVKKIREKLKDKLKNKKELEDALKELEDSLKKKKGDRKKVLESAQKEFKNLQEQAKSATGLTSGHKVQNQGRAGGEAWRKAKEFGLNVNYSGTNGTNTADITNGVLDDALKQIEEELKRLGESQS